MLEQVILILLAAIVGSFLVPYFVRAATARNRLTALIVELRYNRIVLNRYKEKGSGIWVITRSAYEEFRKDFMLARVFVKDSKFHVFDRIHNAYAFHDSRLVENKPSSWNEVYERFKKADKALMDFLKEEKPRFNGFVPVFDEDFFVEMDSRLGESEPE